MSAAKLILKTCESCVYFLRYTVVEKSAEIKYSMCTRDSGWFVIGQTPACPEYEKKEQWRLPKWKSNEK